jgi:hypothetical protein
MEQFSGLAAETVSLPIEIIADLPVFCEPLLSDNGSRLAGINFWAVDATDDAEGDRSWGWYCGDEAVRYARERDMPEFLTTVLLWMGGTLHHESRCPGPWSGASCAASFKIIPKPSIECLWLCIGTIPNASTERSMSHPPIIPPGSWPRRMCAAVAAGHWGG